MDGARSVDSASRSGATREDQAIQPELQGAMFACSICFHTVTNPVATTCGHLFCWECLYMWLLGRARPCPVCRTELIQGVNIIPIYTGDDELLGPHSSGNAAIPQRPHPPSPGRRQGPIPLPSPVEMNMADDRASAVTTDRLMDILDDLTENYEISRERVDTLGRTVEDLVRWNSQLRQEMFGMRRQHAREIDRMHRLRFVDQGRGTRQ